MGKIEEPREPGNSGKDENYLGNEVERMVSTYKRLEKLNPNHYLLKLIRFEKDGNFISTQEFMTTYHDILDKKEKIIIDVIDRNRNAFDHYGRDLEEAVKELKK